MPPPGGKSGWVASRVTVCDLDGKNAKTAVTREYNETITGIDWGNLPPKEEEKPKQPISAPLPKEKPAESSIVIASYLDKYGHGKKGIQVHKTDGKLLRDITPSGPFDVAAFRIAPNGRQLAYTEFDWNTPKSVKSWTMQAVRVIDLDDK